MSTLASTRPPSTPHWYWAAPRIAVLLFVIAVAVLLWLLHRQELEERRANLITDVLWVEQDLEFQMSRNQELLQSLALDYFSGRVTGERFEARARSLMANSPGMVDIVAVDDDGRVRIAVPHARGPSLGEEGLRSESLIQAFRLARSTGKASYSEPHRSSEHDTEFEVVVPDFRDEHHRGSVIATYSLRALLARHVPWWFAQQYRLTVLDAGGAVLASKSNVDAGRASLEYQIPFDPPGYGLVLHFTAYQTQTNLVRNLLAVALFALAIGVLTSLWALRRHVRRRLAAEAELRKEHAFRQAMEESMPTGLRARDMEGRITYVNPAFCRMVGFSAHELVGRLPPLPYWDLEDLATHEHQSEQVLLGQAPEEGFEARLRHKDGHVVHTQFYSAPLRDAEGHQTGWLSSVLDVTEVKRAEEIARQQQEKLQFTSRLVTMGEMASALAHELNQPLSAIASYTAGCLNRIERQDLLEHELQATLRKMAVQAQRAGLIIRRVHEFVKKSAPRRAACCVNTVIEDAVGFVESNARKRHVRIQLNLSAHLPGIEADRVMLEQVVLNLVRNGMDAMNGTPIRSRVLTITTRVDDDATVVSVADRGGGISPEVRAHLFEPFFSTKPEGMGMGLNICRSIIEFHKGRLWVETGDGEGTTFFFSLPLSQT